MERWETKNIHIGRLTAGQDSVIAFKSKEKIEDIVNISTSCYCTGANYDKESQIMTVRYKPQPVPEHLKMQGFYEITQAVVATYNDGGADRLEFHAVVNDK